MDARQYVSLMRSYQRAYYEYRDAEAKNNQEISYIRAQRYDEVKVKRQYHGGIYAIVEKNIDREKNFEKEYAGFMEKYQRIRAEYKARADKIQCKKWDDQYIMYTWLTSTALYLESDATIARYLQITPRRMGNYAEKAIAALQEVLDKEEAEGCE